MRLRFRKREDEKGAAMVEFALVATMLLMLVMGAFEYGMALRDWLSVTVATREGARVAASAADFDNADCVILEATAGALQSFRSGDIEYVFIYRSDANGSIPGDVTTSPPGGDALMNIYRPYFGDPDIPIPSCPFWTEHSIGGSWDPADRLNPNPFGDPYWIGVSLRYTHEWYTGFMFWNGTATFRDSAVFKVEPQAPES